MSLGTCRNRVPSDRRKAESTGERVRRVSGLVTIAKLVVVTLVFIFIFIFAVAATSTQPT